MLKIHFCNATGRDTPILITLPYFTVRFYSSFDVTLARVAKLFHFQLFFKIVYIVIV